jgi:hypothetical protein
VRRGEVRLQKIDSSENIADIFTKNLQATKFVYLSNKMISKIDVATGVRRDILPREPSRAARDSPLKERCDG